jgi:ubiquitin carboxyl-terminal hydrolase 6/32
MAKIFLGKAKMYGDEQCVAASVSPSGTSTRAPSPAPEGGDVGPKRKRGPRDCYLVTGAWFGRWKHAAGLNGGTVVNGTSVRNATRAQGSGVTTVAAASAAEAVGCIDNHTLIVTSGPAKTQLVSRWGARLRPGLRIGQDFVALSKEVWETFHEWYGGGPPLPRPLVATERGTLEVELIPQPLRIMRYVPHKNSKLAQIGSILLGKDGDNKPEKPPQITFFFNTDCSRAMTVRALIRNICKLQASLPRGYRGATPDTVRLWDYRNPECPVLLDDEDATVNALKLKDDHPLLMEVRNVDLTWPSEVLAVARASQHGSKVVDVAMDPTACRGGKEGDNGRPLGVAGLSNLGNTCFMNAGLQCLSNTPPLTTYFLNHLHYGELNRTNALGYKGVVARRYGELLKQLWAARGSVAPVKLKHTLQKVAPRFAGYQQHDAQELLNFLLDGLHEDLNR